MIVRLNYDCARLGCGYRCYIVLKIGRKWVDLFYPPALLSLKIAKADFDRLASPIFVNKRGMAARIRADVRKAKHLGLSDGGAKARAAIAALRGPR